MFNSDFPDKSCRVAADSRKKVILALINFIRELKTVLLITDVNFWERSSGNRARIYSLVEYLAPRTKLTVINTGPAPQHIETWLTATFHAEFLVLEQLKYLNSNGYGRRMQKMLKGRIFDVVVIQYIHSSYFLNFLNGDPKVILDAHDIISERAAGFREFNYAGELYEITEETEKEIFGVYDHIITLCDADAHKVALMAGSKKALLCPHPAGVYSHPIRGEVKNIVFMGSAYLPNKDAIEWFITQCWPRLHKAYGITLSVYGTVCSKLNIGFTEGVIPRGFVADANEIYDEADIVINPVRFGAGLKIKNIEALSHGRPLITTTHGARGIDTGAGTAFLIANDASDFIRQITTLVDSFDQRWRLSQVAASFIRQNFTAEQCFRPLLEAIISNGSPDET